MNNKGQVLIFFVLIIPLLLLGAAYIIDSTYIAYNTNKLNGINSLIIRDASIKKLSVEEIKEYIKKNDKDIEIEFIFVSDEKLELNLKKEIKSLFGVIIGKDSYTITSNKILEINLEDIPIYQ